MVAITPAADKDPRYHSLEITVAGTEFRDLEQRFAAEFHPLRTLLLRMEVEMERGWAALRPFVTVVGIFPHLARNDVPDHFSNLVGYVVEKYSDAYRAFYVQARSALTSGKMDLTAASNDIYCAQRALYVVCMADSKHLPEDVAEAVRQIRSELEGWEDRLDYLVELAPAFVDPEAATFRAAGGLEVADFLTETALTWRAAQEPVQPVAEVVS